MLTWCSIVNAPSKIAQRKGERRLGERSEMANASCGMELQSWVEAETLDAVPRLDDEGEPLRDIFQKEGRYAIEEGKCVEIRMRVA